MEQYHPGEPTSASLVTQGDLSGAYTDLTVESIQGVVISGTPAAGDGLYATGTATAAWSASRLLRSRAIFDNAGDLLVGTGSGTGEILPIGSVGQALVVGGADPSGLEWGWPVPTIADSLNGSLVTATGSTTTGVITGINLTEGQWVIPVNALISYDSSATLPVIILP